MSPRSKSDRTLKKCTGMGIWVRHLAANQSAQRVRRNSARGPQSLVEPKWPDGAELHR